MTIFIMPLIIACLVWLPQVDMFLWLMGWYLVGGCLALARRLTRRKRERGGGDGA